MAAALWMKRQIMTFTEKTDNFLLLAPTYKVMNQSLLPYFLHVMEGLGDYNKTDAEYKTGWGSTVYLRTGKDPDSIVGVPNVRAYWLDEAGKATLYFWNNIQARAASKGARGLLTTSPYSLNWLYQDYIKPIMRGQKQHVPLIQAASWDNPYHSLYDPAKRAQMASEMDPRRFNMIFGGQWGRMEGLVYDCWSDEENFIDPIPLPAGTIYVGGVDWGYYPDPFVLKVRAITPDGRHYGVSEYYANHKTITDLVPLVKAKKEIFGIKTFYCDPSQPGYIEEFNRNGLSAIGADNDIRRGVDLHYELIKTRKYKEFKGTCPLSTSERESYHYPEEKDLKPDQHSKELKPVDQNNHSQDADRYITISTYRSQLKHSPKLPGDSEIKTQAERIERLKRRSSREHSESWRD